MSTPETLFSSSKMLIYQQQKLLRHCSRRPSTFQHQVVNARFTILKHKVEYYGGIKIPGFRVNTSSVMPSQGMIVSSVYPDYRISSLSPGVDQLEDGIRSRDLASTNQRTVFGLKLTSQSCSNVIVMMDIGPFQTCPT